MIIKTATADEELSGIKLLQQLNLKSGISQLEAAAEGFLTAEYSLNYITQMNAVTPAIIAKDGNTVVGYALATTRETGRQHDLLNDLFATIDKLFYNRKPLATERYIVVGQLCVAKSFRGMGLVQQLYNRFRETYSPVFDYAITDVAESNPRSLKAHIKSGFRVIDTLRYGGISWSIVLWDWKV